MDTLFLNAAFRSARHLVRLKLYLPSFRKEEAIQVERGAYLVLLEALLGYVLIICGVHLCFCSEIDAAFVLVKNVE